MNTENGKKLKIDKTTCWYDNDKAPKQMIRGARGELWPTLENSAHFPILEQLINAMLKQCSSCISLVEVGCGAAEFQRVFTNFFYTGADLPNVIDNVAKIVNPIGRYIKFDLYKNEMKFLNDFDSVLMNAFIDVLEYPIFGFEKVLNNSNSYVLLHRQTLTREKTHTIINDSYGGKTYKSLINFQEFMNVLTEKGFTIVEEIRFPFEPNTFSFLLRKVK